jgi:hypothetical protein
MKYRIVLAENNFIQLPKELVDELQLQPGTIFLCHVDKGVLTLAIEEKNTEPLRVEVDIIDTDIFWLPAEIAYFPDQVRVRCKEPFVEVWASDRAQAILKFKVEAAKFYR